MPFFAGSLRRVVLLQVKKHCLRDASFYAARVCVPEVGWLRARALGKARPAEGGVWCVCVPQNQ